MEVTFLSSTGSFGGVEYNLSKVMKNAGEILDVVNFDGLSHVSNPTIGDYTNYLKTWSERNSRIKNSQFHVSISCRGHEKSKEELLGVAKQWLKEMGYEGIPALFVFHHDTDNNHIHIISSRVGTNSKKVSDSNERWRGRAVLKRIEGVRLSEEAKAIEAISDALSYKYQNEKQFLMILESKNYRIKEAENGDYLLLKYGKKVGTVLKSDIINAGRKNNGESTERRGKQLKAILHKYGKLMSLSELKDLMRRSFGVELVFFGNANKPYGYALIDHKDKVVYKGSEVIPLKELLGEKGENREKETPSAKKGEDFISMVLEGKNKATTREINAFLRRYGYSIKKGNILYYGKILGQISDKISDVVKYNDRLFLTRKILTDDPQALNALARHFKVNRNDLSISDVTNKANNSDFYSLQDLYDRSIMSGNLYYNLKLYNIILIEDEGRKYLLDVDSGCIEQIMTTASERIKLIEGQEMAHNASESSVSVQDISSLFMDNSTPAGGAMDNDLAKKKRRRR